MTNTNTVQEKVKADWEKAQKEGGQRVERIREIVKAAATEALSEIKGGSSELESISRQTLAEMIAQLKAKEAAEADATVVEQTVAGQTTDADGIGAESTESSDHTPGTPSWQQLLADLFSLANERKGGWAQQVLARIQTQMDRFDADMATEYSDRYQPFRPVVKGLRSLIDLAYAKVATGSQPAPAEPVQIVVLDDGETPVDDSTAI